MAFRSYRRTSAKAILSHKVTFISFQLLILTLILHRFASLHTPAAMAIFAFGLICCLLAFLLAFWALVQIWNKGFSGARRAFISIFLAILVLAGPAYYFPKFINLPLINDITTDFSAPPSFEVLAQQRSAWANSIIYPGDDFSDKQKEAYPKVRPMILERSAKEAYDLVAQAVGVMKWNIAAQQAPGKGGASGWIEATDKTLIMGFIDDIVVRVSGDDAGARIDVRSASRYGRHDLGENAQRIQNLFVAIRTSLAKGEQQMKLEKELAEKRALRLMEAEKKRRAKAAQAQRERRERARRDILNAQESIKRKPRIKRRRHRDTPWDIFSE